jgi:hypothetical protein
MTRRNFAVYALATALGALAVAGAYVGLPVGDVEDQRRGTNAIQLFVWNQWETGKTSGPWEYTLAPCFVPVTTIAGALGLAALRPLRALPWVLGALLCFVLALGDSAENALWLEHAFGPTAGAVGRAVVTFNQHVHVPIVRFPRRWLVPGAMGLGVAAGIGLSRIPYEGVRFLIACVAAYFTVTHTLALTRYQEAIPSFPEPQADFADFIRDYPEKGAIIALPTIRAAKSAAARREDVPIWAELDPNLRTADQFWIQTATGRATVFLPLGMRTMQRRTDRERENGKLLRDLDDLSLPQTTGDPIPPSATQEPHRRAAAAARLIAKGLRFVAVDAKLYGADGLALAKLPFTGHIVEERTFDDGTGVVVWVLK